MGKIRESNIELLRIIAMFMIMVVHGNFGAIGTPSSEELFSKPISSFVWIETESLSIVCVSLFILISGWFGLRPSKTNILKFLFQIFFFYIGIYGVVLLLGKTSLTVTGLLHTFLLSPLDYFIKSYLFLMILAPILNIYVEHASRSTQKNVLIYFFVFQTIFGWATKGASFFLNGYSVVSFVGLYLLARYVRVFQPKIFSLDKKVDLLIYVVCTLGITAGAYIAIITGFKSGMIVYNYTCPLGIMASLYLFLFFTKFHFRSSMVNSIAASSFAIYLFHRQFVVFDYFQNHLRDIFYSHEGVSVLLLFIAYMLLVSMFAVIIDQVRVLCWKQLSNLL